MIILWWVRVRPRNRNWCCASDASQRNDSRYASHSKCCKLVSPAEWPRQGALRRCFNQKALQALLRLIIPRALAGLMQLHPNGRETDRMIDGTWNCSPERCQQVWRLATQSYIRPASLVSQSVRRNSLALVKFV